MQRQIARMALLTAVGLALSWLEGLLPPIGMPGVKLGLANLATLMALYLLSPGQALLISMARVLLAGFLFGSMSSMIYAVLGALAAWGGMAALRRVPAFSILGVSAAGGCLHNAAQLGVAALSVGTRGLLVYLPILVVAGVITGCANGIIAKIVLARLR